MRDGAAPMPGARAAPRDVPLDLLRTCVVLLVVAHHATLAYHAYAPPQERLGAPSMAWTAFPIVDERRRPGVEVLVAFNDLFFMSLLFLISGVFAGPSLVRKGARPFVRDRALRVGLQAALGHGGRVPGRRLVAGSTSQGRADAAGCKSGGQDAGSSAG